MTQQVASQQVASQQGVAQQVVTQQVMTQDVVTQQVRRVASDVCARPNTFEVVTVQRQVHGERDTLTSRCCDDGTTTTR